MTKRALFVGVDRYADESIEDLECAVNDATELAGFFRHRAGYDRAEALPNPRNRDEVLARVEGLTRGLGAGDEFVFFFAGHGFTVKNNHVLVCAGDRYGEVAHEWAGLPLEMLKWRTAGAFDRVFLLDACRTDLLAGHRGAAAGMATGTRDLILSGAGDGGAGVGRLTVLCSCDEGQTAGELRPRRHGIFSLAMLELLEEGASAGLRVEVGDEFQERVGERMRQLAAEAELPCGQRPQKQGPRLLLLDGLVSVSKIVPMSTKEELDGRLEKLRLDMAKWDGASVSAEEYSLLEEVGKLADKVGTQIGAGLLAEAGVEVSEAENKWSRFEASAKARLDDLAREARKVLEKVPKNPSREEVAALEALREAFRPYEDCLKSGDQASSSKCAQPLMAALDALSAERRRRRAMRKKANILLAEAGRNGRELGKTKATAVERSALGVVQRACQPMKAALAAGDAQEVTTFVIELEDALRKLEMARTAGKKLRKAEAALALVLVGGEKTGMKQTPEEVVATKEAEAALVAIRVQQGRLGDSDTCVRAAEAAASRLETARKVVRELRVAETARANPGDEKEAERLRVLIQQLRTQCGYPAEDDNAPVAGAVVREAFVATSLPVRQEMKGGGDLFLRQVRLEDVLRAADARETTGADRQALVPIRKQFEKGVEALRAGRDGEAERLFAETEIALGKWKERVSARQEAQAVFQNTEDRQRRLEDWLGWAKEYKVATGAEREALAPIRELCSAGAKALQGGRISDAERLLSDAEQLRDEWWTVFAVRIMRKRVAWSVGGLLAVLLGLWAVWHWRNPLWALGKPLWAAYSEWLKGGLAVLGAWSVEFVVGRRLAQTYTEIIWAELLAAALTGLVAWWLGSWAVCMLMAAGLCGGLWFFGDEFHCRSLAGYVSGALLVALAAWGGIRLCLAYPIVLKGGAAILVAWALEAFVCWLIADDHSIVWAELLAWVLAGLTWWWTQSPWVGWVCLCGTIEGLYFAKEEFCFDDGFLIFTWSLFVIGALVGVLSYLFL